MDFAEVPCKVREERISRIMTQYGRELKRMCYMYLKDQALAEDAVQDTFLKAYKALNDFREESSEKTWLMRIAVNTCKDYLRTAWFRRVDRRRTLDELPEQGHEPQMPDPTVMQEIMSLSAKHCEVILLRYYQEMEIADIVAALNLPEGTVKSRLARAREKLATKLERWYFDEE
ncbi:MAG: sigma-70 family RNA polymerase sigma factor [Christensenellales bacterium]|jgi:RNA polymerase sigma-70 factor (ECF subfamily)